MIMQNVEEFSFHILVFLIGIIAFVSGFILVYKNLKKVNLIEGEKFNLSDWLSCVLFGLMFAASIMFASEISIQVLVPFASVTSIASITLIILLSILIVYPLWEIFFLGRPTSDSVHNFHKFLETKILDKFQGGMAYFIAFLIFLVLYIVPVILISTLTPFTFGEILIMWFLLFPLFFLNYFAASGLVANIINGTYVNRPYLDKKEYKYLLKEPNWKNPKDLFTKTMHAIVLLIVWTPFLLAIYNLINPIIKLIQGDIEVAITSQNTSQTSGVSVVSAYISLFTTVVFGIQGFFKRFWSKKSKTKTIDFIFSGYIFIAIGVNMLINFTAINPAVINDILSFQIGTWTPLESVRDFLSHYEVLLPIITIQAFVSVVYGFYVGLNKNSDFHADIRLSAVNNAFGLHIEDIIDPKKRKKATKRKYNLPVLIKSVLLPPVYSKYAIDLNKPVREKAGQFLYMIALENKDYARKIVDLVAKNTIEISSESFSSKSLYKKFLSFIGFVMGKGKPPEDVFYLSKEAVDLLGNIGAFYPDLVLQRLIDSLEHPDVLMQKYVLDALGDVGESEKNLVAVLEKIKPLLSTEADELRTAAYASVVEMIVEGETENETFINTALTYIYEILEDPLSTDEVIESALDALVSITDKVPELIDLNKITPLLDFEKRNRKDDHPEIVYYVIQNTISILGSIVYYHLEEFEEIILKIHRYIKDPRDNIRYVAVDAIGNYMLKGKEELKESFLNDLIDLSLEDPDPDVAAMAAESITEFLIMNGAKYNEVTYKGTTQSILDIYISALKSESRNIAENASEALKSIAPLFKTSFYSRIETFLKGNNSEIIRDLLELLGKLDKEIQQLVDLPLIYSFIESEDPTVRGKAAFCLGLLAEGRGKEIDEGYLIDLLDDKDPTVRLEAIFALGKIGKVKPESIVPILIEKFFQLDRTLLENVSETELYAESLGVIGSVHPSREIIICLYQALLGDTNPFAKDVVARALYQIGEGMIRHGNAIALLENEEFYNSISWLKFLGERKEYSIGNLVIMMIEALQQKGIPSTVMDIISDSLQDLLPVFLFLKNERKENQILEAIKDLLAQAYYSNYEQEILETIDRIDSLISFKRYFYEEDETLKKQFIFYAKQFTPDGKQFHDQGELFLLIALKEKRDEFLDYALKSFEIAIALAPYEYYTPNCILQIAHIYREKGEYSQAIKHYKEAQIIFASLDEIEKMKEIENALQQLQ